MPKYSSEQMLTCIVTLTPKQALALRDLGIDLEFRCPNSNCNQPVKPVGKGKDTDGVEYKAHFEHKTRNPKCHFGVGIKPSTVVERNLEKTSPEDKLRNALKSGIVSVEPVLAGTGYWGRAEAEFANAMGDEKDPERKREMRKRYEELASQLKNLGRKERESKLLDEIRKWKKQEKD